MGSVSLISDKGNPSAMFGFGKKRLANNMIGGVDIVKLVLYKVLTDDFSMKYKENGEKFYKTLAGTIINELFGSHNEASRQMFNDNKATILSEINNIGTNHSELRRPITDALRVFVQANFMLSGKWKPEYQEILDKAMERGLLIKGGAAPEPKSFLEMTSKLIDEYNIS
jgi:hypothetical protein